MLVHVVCSAENRRLDSIYLTRHSLTNILCHGISIDDLIVGCSAICCGLFPFFGGNVNYDTRGEIINSRVVHL